MLGFTEPSNSNQMLEIYREQLQRYNVQFLDVLEQRYKIAKTVMRLKKEENQPVYTPEQELILFSTNKLLKPEQTLSQLYLWSELIRIQAGAGYPDWTNGEHLKAKNARNLVEKTNPLLLMCWQLFPDNLMLNDEFIFLEKLYQQKLS